MCEICIGVYYPLKFKLKTHRGFPIIADDGNFGGLRGRYRSLQLIKNRQGESEKAIAVNFFGEIGYFREFPKVDTISDFSIYTEIDNKQESIDEINKDDVQDKQTVKFSF